MTNDSKAKVIIVDDDPGAIAKLQEMLKSYSDLEVVAGALSAAEALRCVETHKPQLLFLDIDLPDGNGLQLIESISRSENVPYIVMYTAFYDKFSSDGRAFAHGENDYLLKPIDSRELDKTIQRFRYASAPGKHESTFHTLGNLNNSEKDNRIVVALTKVTSEIRVLHISDIGYFTYNSRRKLWEAVTRDNTIVTLKKSTSASDILEYSPKLIQTHQSFIVNLDYVMLIGKSKVNMFAPFQDAEILVGRIYLKNLQNRFMYL